MPEMHKVESSNIDKVGYDEKTRGLHVKFKGNAATYVYADVPVEKFKELKAAKSVGKYLNTAIKGVHVFDKIPAEDAKESAGIESNAREAKHGD